MAKWKAAIMSAALFCALSGFAAAQDFQALSAEFMQKWQAANSARMAGEYDKAIELFEECLDEKFDNEYLAPTKSGVHLSLGFLYSTYLNQKEEARTHLEKYIEMIQSQPRVDDPSMAQMNAVNETMTANAYRMLENYEKMVEHMLKSIEYYEAYWASDAPYKMGEADYKRTLAPNYYYLALGYRFTGDEEAALKNYRKTAELYESLLAGEHPADVEMMLSYIHRELGNLEKCIEFYLKYLEKSEKAAAGDETRKTMMDISRIALAHYYYDAKQWDKAMGEIERSSKAALSLDWTSDLWRAYHLKGKIHKKLGEPGAALEAYKKSIEVIESQRSGLGAGDDRASFMELHTAVYHDIIRLLIEMGRPGEALEYLERSKARSFLDMLGGRRLGLRSPKESETLGRQLELQKEISGFTLAMQAQGAGSAAESAAGLRDAKRRYAELMKEVRDMSPEFSSLVSVSPPKTGEITSALDGDTAIIEYFPADDSLNIWVIRSDGITLRSTETKRKKVETQVKMLRSKVTRGAAGDSYVKTARKLYEILIGPVADLIEGEGTLVIVPHGPLHYLPFNMLMDGDEFLIDRHAVVLAPSASALSYILEKGGAGGGRLLALGDPETTLPELPAAREEVSAIRGNFTESSVFTGGDAVESLLYGGGAQAADVLHVASHGLFYPDKPMFSALALSADKEKATDGFLQVHEIFGLNLAETELVTLSACETGLSAISGGDELVGLSRAFVYSGAPRVIVSLWSVNDFSTGELMKILYGAMDESGVAAALRKAQLELKSNPDLSHPFFWAPFQLIGDWR